MDQHKACFLVARAAHKRPYHLGQPEILFMHSKMMISLGQILNLLVTQRLVFVGCTTNTHVIQSIYGKFDAIQKCHSQCMSKCWKTLSMYTYIGPSTKGSFRLWGKWCNSKGHGSLYLTLVKARKQWYRIKLLSIGTKMPVELKLDFQARVKLKDQFF